MNGISPDPIRIPAMADKSSGANKLSGIEAGRGIAALLVVGVHTRGHLFKGGAQNGLADLFLFGHSGVDFFFVLSGFIIMYVHYRDIGRPERVGNYLRRRFTRIYPFYWAMSLLTLATVALSAHQVMPSLTTFVVSFFLFPVAVEPIIGVAWTLQHEVTFYAIFLTLILNYALGVGVFLAWLGVIVAGLFVSDFSLAAVSSWLNLHFFVGMGTAWLLRHRTIPRPKAVLLLGFLIFLSAGIAENLGIIPGRSHFTHLGYGVGSGLAILGLVEAERQNRLHVPRVMIALGGASYSIYLTHLLSIGAVWQILQAAHLTDVLPAWVQFLTLFTGGAFGGWVISRLIEHPTTEIARWLTNPKPRPAEAAPLPR